MSRQVLLMDELKEILDKIVPEARYEEGLTYAYFYPPDREDACIIRCELRGECLAIYAAYKDKNGQTGCVLLADTRGTGDFIGISDVEVHNNEITYRYGYSNPLNEPDLALELLDQKNQTIM